LVGAECKGSPDRGYKHSFAQNPSNRHPAGGNCGLCRIIFHMNLATSVDESAPVRQSLFLQTAPRLAPAGGFFTVWPSLGVQLPPGSLEQRSGEKW
jgi:hypothetical protein